MSDVGAGAVDAGGNVGQTGQGSVNSPTPDAGAAGADAGVASTAPVSDPTPAAPADWRTSLPEDLRASAALTDVQDVGSLAKQFIDLQAHMGNSLRIPGPDAAEGDWNGFNQKLVEKVPGLMPRPDPANGEAMDAVYQALGRPEDADQYTRPLIEGALETAEGVDQSFAEAAHEAGINQRQFDTIYGRVMQNQMVVHQERMAQSEAKTAELRQEWGYTYEPRMQAIQGTFEKLGAPQELMQAISDRKVSPDAAKFFHNIVEGFGGATSEMAQQDGGAKNVMTPAEAELQLMEIQRNPDYHHHDPAVRQPLMDKYQQLLVLAKPELLSGEEAMRDLKRSSSGSR